MCYADLIRKNVHDIQAWIKVLSTSKFVKTKWEDLLGLAKNLTPKELLEVHDVLRQKPYGFGVGNRIQRWFRTVLEKYFFQHRNGSHHKELRSLVAALHLKERFQYLFNK